MTDEWRGSWQKQKSATVLLPSFKGKKEERKPLKPVILEKSKIHRSYNQKLNLRTKRRRFLDGAAENDENADLLEAFSLDCSRLYVGKSFKCILAPATSSRCLNQPACLLVYLHSSAHIFKSVIFGLVMKI